MVLEQLFGLMADKKASDLLLSPNSPVTLKMQGVMVPVNQSVLLTGTDIFKMLLGVCSQEQMAELEHTHELNIGIFRAGTGSFRLSAFKQKHGLAAVFRFIPPQPPTFEQLSLPSALRTLSLEQRGLILVCGATGSGKSSTIAAILEARNEQKSGHILTVEDPVEFNFTPKKAIFNQREIGADALDLATALRNGLRQTPDVIFIGEVRDQATMTAAMTYALSGHLVFTTLHANNSYHALSRILSMYSAESRGVLLSDLSASIKCVMTQRLVKTVSGGRVPALEIMHNTQLTAELIEQGKMFELREAIASSMAAGSQTFEQSLVALVNAGTVTREEAMAAADSSANLVWLLNNQGIKATDAAKPQAPIDRSASGAQYKEFNFG